MPEAHDDMGLGAAQANSSGIEHVDEGGSEGVDLCHVVRRRMRAGARVEGDDGGGSAAAERNRTKKGRTQAHTHTHTMLVGTLPVMP